MSPVMKERPDGTLRPARHRALQPTALLWLTAVWVGLWGDLSIANVLSGLALGVVVSLVFPMPPVKMRLRIRPLRLAWLVAHFLYDVVVASAQVAAKTVAPRGTLRNSVVAVNLRTPSDFVLTVVAEMSSLIPGSIVVEARRNTHTLYLHVLDTPDSDAVERARERTYALERRVVMAIGADTEHLEGASPAAPGGASR